MIPSGWFKSNTLIVAWPMAVKGKQKGSLGQANGNIHSDIRLVLQQEIEGSQEYGGS